MSKNVVILLDNSASMHPFASQVPSVLKDAIENLGAKDRITLHRFGYGVNDPDFVNLTKSKIGDINYWPNEGRTGIYKAIAKIGPINGLVLLITDGDDNIGGLYEAKKAIADGYANDNYTIGVMCPRHMVEAMRLTLGIDNVTGWDTVEDMREGTQCATRTYSASTGQTIRSGLFGVSVKAKDVKRELVEISKPKMCGVPKEQDISGFVTDWRGSYAKGEYFYQLTKKELVQEYKKIVFWNKKTNKWYTGTISECRKVLGLPDGARVRVEPESLGNFLVFIQSTSMNRKLVRGTTLVHYVS